MPATIENPRLRTPLSLILDDSCPVINLTYYWIRQRHAWKARHQPGVPPDRWEGDPEKLHLVPEAIPADFARRFGEWCGEAGVRGKFSVIPYPAGLGRIDRHLPGHSDAELQEWLTVIREVIHPQFDLTPEMLTHTHVLDLRTLEPTEAWEQREWVDPVPQDLLTEYITLCFEILKNVGIAAEGVTSPGAFGKRMEDRYARAVLLAALAVTGNRLPFYFLHVVSQPGRIATCPLQFWGLRPEAGVVSVVGATGDWFGGWTGYDLGHPDRFLTEDLRGGRVAEVLAAQAPCILVGHWPGIYYGGEASGFAILKEVKRRLDRYDPTGERTCWMKTSEIARYWAARQLAWVDELPAPAGEWRARIRCPLAADDFTLRVVGVRAKLVEVAGAPLALAAGPRHLRAATYLLDGTDTVLCWNLSAGETELRLVRA